MKDISVNFNPLLLLGFSICKVPEDVIKVIKKEIFEIKENNFKDAIPQNKFLAGAIEHEYRLCKLETIKTVNELVNKVAQKYYMFWNNEVWANKTYALRNQGINDLWVNFQKKYEFNPLHHHSGTLSFVIWIQVPYDVKEEQKLPHFINLNTKEYARFKFRYPSFLDIGGISTTDIEINKEMENHMIMFPSWLKHEVVPFYTSDEYRISVSGNIDPI